MARQNKFVLIAYGVAVAAAIGVGAWAALGSGDGTSTVNSSGVGKSAANIPAYCTDGAEGGWNPASGMCNIRNVAGCQHVTEFQHIDTQLASENPFRSSGYSGSTAVVPLLTKMKDLTEEDLKQPNIPDPIKVALQNQAKELQKEIDLYNQRGNWVEVNTKRGLSETSSSALACLNFVADEAKFATPAAGQG
ncbi:hypothetical protein [Nonomuraea sp. NPDC004354]